MHSAHLNRLSTWGLVILSLFASVPLAFIGLRFVLTGYVPPPAEDEGTLAHIFQLAVVLLAPVGMVFLATADWNAPRRVVQRLAFPAAAVVLAFAILFYFEKIYYPAHF